MALHNAPPVVYPVGRSHFHAGLLLGLWLTGSMALLWWVCSAVVPAYGVAVAGVLVLCLGMAALRAWIQAPEGQLAWDGEVWRWQSAGYQAGEATYRLTVGADFQRVLLLRLENSARASLWVWAGAASFPERWLDLRRAVYSPGRVAPSWGSADAPQLQGAAQGMAVSGAMQPRDLPLETPPAPRWPAQEGDRP